MVEVSDKLDYVKNIFPMFKTTYVLCIDIGRTKKITFSFDCCLNHLANLVSKSKDMHRFQVKKSYSISSTGGHRFSISEVPGFDNFFVITSYFSLYTQVINYYYS